MFFFVLQTRTLHGADVMKKRDWNGQKPKKEEHALEKKLNGITKFFEANPRGDPLLWHTLDDLIKLFVQQTLQQILF